jgi:flagellar basal body rod protein FlgG
MNTFTPEQVLWIRGEITRQIIEAKKVIDVEIAKDIERAKAEIIAEVTRDVSEVTESLERKVSESNQQLVVAGKNQLELTRQTTRELVKAVGQEITDAVYDRVTEEINTKVMPQMTKMVQYVQYQMQDGSELVKDYRMAVEEQSSGGRKMLTGGNESHIISPHVRTFFNSGD